MYIIPKVIRPIQFDNPRKQRRNRKARAAKKVRDIKRTLPGGDMHYPAFWAGLREDKFWLFDGGAYYGPVNDNRERNR